MSNALENQLKLANVVDASTFSSIAAAMAAGNGKRLHFPAGTYTVTSPLVFSNLADMQITGDGFASVIAVATAISCWEFDSSCSNITIEDLAFAGQSTGTEGKHAISLKAPRSTVRDCYIHDFNLGVMVQHENAADCSITGNLFKDIKGATSGNGYAAYTIGQRTVIANNHFVSVGRHDVYLSGSTPQGAQDCVVEGNTSVSCGAEAIALYAQAAQGPVRGCVIQGNTIKSAATTAIGLTQRVTDCIVANNTIHTPGSYGIQLEGSTADNTYPLRNVVTGNSVLDAGVRHINCINASDNVLTGNVLAAVGVVPSSLSGITVDSTGTPTAYPSNNLVGPNVYKGLSVTAAPFIGSNAGLFYGSAPRAEQESWLTFAAADTTPSVAGGKRFVVTNAGPVSITNFDDGREGQEITLFFTDGNTTVTTANCYLSGAVNFVGTANDTLTLVKKGIYWYEVRRAVN